MSTSGSSPRARAPRGEGDRTREEILDATERLLLEAQREDAVSIRAIGDAVGVTPPSIYRHFEDKDTLMLAVCTRHFTRMDARAEAAAREVDDPVASLRARGLAYVKDGLENPGTYRILFLGGVHVQDDFDLERMPGSEAFLHLVDAVERCIETGAFHRVDAFETAAGLWTVVHGVTSLQLSHPEFPWPEDLAEQVIDAQLRGLRADD